MLAQETLDAVFVVVGYDPDSLYYERSANAAVALFTFSCGTVASLAFTHGASKNAGMERTTIVSDADKHITVENNVRISYHRNAARGYGNVPDYYVDTPALGTLEQAWQATRIFEALVQGPHKRIALR